MCDVMLHGLAARVRLLGLEGRGGAGVQQHGRGEVKVVFEEN